MSVGAGGSGTLVKVRARGSRAAAAWLVGVAAVVAGCTHVNEPLDEVSVAVERRELNSTRATTGAGVGAAGSRGARAVVPATSPATAPTTGPSTPDASRPALRATRTEEGAGRFIGVALSGGGSRSANFSAACLFELQRVGLLHRVNYMSSVSGGSLAAAYYCLNGDEKGAWEPEAVQRKLTHAFASDVLGETLTPWNWAALAFTPWDRSDLLAGSFQRVLFSLDGRALTFGDLRKDRPHLLINATDLQSGKRFVFCDEEFDQINSDLSKYPVAYAVAASAAVPVLMHQVTLRDYSTTFKQYRHLIDGGLSDNLGVQTLVETYDAQMAAAERDGRGVPYPRGAVLIIVDARTQHDARLSDKGDVGFIDSLIHGAGLASTALVNRASSATLVEVVTRYSPETTPAKELLAQVDQLERTGAVTLRDRWGNPVEVIHLALLRAGELSNRPYHSFGGSVNGVGTYFNIADNEAYELYQAATLLVKEKFEGRLREIAGN